MPTRYKINALKDVETLGTAAPTLVAVGEAVTARQETVAKESFAQAVSQIMSRCPNSSGLVVAVVDAKAITFGSAALASTTGRLVNVPEILEEVRDATTLWRLALLPTPVETVDLTPEFVKRGRMFTLAGPDLVLLFSSAE